MHPSELMSPVDPHRKPRFGLKTVMDLFDIGKGVAITALTGSLLVLIAAIAYFIHSAPPGEVSIGTGPDGSVYQRYAARYAEILKRDGVKVKIVKTNGSTDNLQRLVDHKDPVDVAFVQAGVAKELPPGLISLGSVSHQPLLVFYRGATLGLLSGFIGKKIAIGPEGSGAHAVALDLLAANGIKPGGPTQLENWEPEHAVHAVLSGAVEAAFVMGDSTPLPMLQELFHSKDLKLFSFREANAYSRRLDYLNVLELPEGAIDLGADLPDHDVSLVGPTVELIAKKGLHPALSDLLVEAAIETHNRPGIFQKRGEFPALQEHSIPVSTDAKRYYQSGKTLFYRYLPFWLASLVSRIVLVIIPTLVILIPALRSIPAFFRWRAQSKIRRHYRDLLDLEKRWLANPHADERSRLRSELDRIESRVNRTQIRAAFADQFYGLRGHISYVRGLLAREPE